MPALLDNLFGMPNIEKLEKENNVKGLIKALQYKDSAIRQGAADALGRLQDPLAIDPLAAATKHKDLATCTHAAAALVKYDNPKATTALIVPAMSNQVIVSQTAFTGLTKRDNPTVLAVLQKLLSQNHAELRIRIFKALQTIASIDAVDSIISFLEDPEFEKFFVISSAKPAGAKPFFVDHRIYAVEALGNIGNKKACNTILPFLLPDIDNQSEKLQETAANALNRMSWKPTNDKYGIWFHILQKNWKECVEISSHSVPILLSILDDKQGKEKCEIIKALGKSKDTRALDSLKILSSSEDSNIKKAALSALSSFDPSDSEAALNINPDDDYQTQKDKIKLLLAQNWKPKKTVEKVLVFLETGKPEELIKLGKRAENFLQVVFHEEKDIQWLENSLICLSAIKEDQFNTWIIKELKNLEKVINTYPAPPDIKFNARKQELLLNHLHSNISDEAVSILLNLMASKYANVRNLAIDSLVQFGEDIAPKIIPLLNAGSGARTSAVIALGRLKYKPSAKRILGLIENKSKTLVSAAADALIQIEDDSIVPQLEKLFEKVDFQVRTGNDLSNAFEGFNSLDSYMDDDSPGHSTHKLEMAERLEKVEEGKRILERYQHVHTAVKRVKDSLKD